MYQIPPFCSPKTDVNSVRKPPTCGKQLTKILYL